MHVNIKNALALKKVPLYIGRMSKSNAIARFRERFGLSQKKMAERLGITSRALRELEAKPNVPLRYELAVEGLHARLLRELSE